MHAGQSQPAAAPSAAEGVTHARAFEALFRSALGIHPELGGILRAQGYDPEHPQQEYPSPVWMACVEAARQALFGERSPEEGQRALGALFADGFRSTAIGQVFEGISSMGEAYLVRLPGLLKLARPDLTLELHFESKRSCWLRISGPNTNPSFMAGLVESRVRQRGLAATVEVASVTQAGYGLLVTW
jgi:uncharacterized protein (TIGR02265 family)